MLENLKNDLITLSNLVFSSTETFDPIEVGNTTCDVIVYKEPTQQRFLNCDCIIRYQKGRKVLEHTVTLFNTATSDHLISLTMKDIDQLLQESRMSQVSPSGITRAINEMIFEVKNVINIMTDQFIMKKQNMTKGKTPEKEVNCLLRNLNNELKFLSFLVFNHNMVFYPLLQGNSVVKIAISKETTSLNYLVAHLFINYFKDNGNREYLVLPLFYAGKGIEQKPLKLEHITGFFKDESAHNVLVIELVDVIKSCIDSIDEQLNLEGLLNTSN